MINRLLPLAFIALLASPLLPLGAQQSAQGTGQNPAADALTSAILACNEKQDPTCVVDLSTKGIGQYPDHWIFHFLLGAGLLDLKRFDESIAEQTRAVTMNAQVAQAFYLRAMAYEGVQEYDMAIADARKTLEVQPDHPKAKKYLDGLIASAPKGAPTVDGLLKSIADCNASKNYECSAHLGTKGIGLFPSDARFLYLRGQALGNANRFAESVADLSKAIQLNPRYSDALTLRAILYELSGNYDKAIGDYRTFVQNDPSNTNYVIMAKAINRMAVEKMKCGAPGSVADKADCAAKLNMAVDAMSTAMTHDPGTLTFVILGERMTSYRALTTVGVDRTKEADADAARSLQNLDSTATRMNAKLDEVLKAQKEILPYVTRIKACYEVDDFACMMATANEGLKTYPNGYILFYWRGVAHARRRESVAAIADFTKTLEINPSLQQALTLRGTAYLESNDLDRAIADFRSALERNPDDADAKSKLAAALAKKAP